MGIVGATTDTCILFENGVRRNRLVLPGLSNAADHMPSKPDWQIKCHCPWGQDRLRDRLLGRTIDS
jgi:hypothetical protein